MKLGWKRLRFSLRITSIRYKYILSTTALFLVFVFSLLFVWYTSLRDEAQKQATTSIRSIMTVSSNSFENYVRSISEIEALLTTHSSNYLTSNMIELLNPENHMSSAQRFQCTEEASDFLVSLCSFKQYLTGLTVTDLKGNTMTYGITTRFDRMRTMPWYESVSTRTNSDLIFIPPYEQYTPGDLRNGKVFAIARPIISQGKEIGFIYAEISCNSFSGAYTTSGLDGMSLYIADMNFENLIYTSDTSGNRSGQVSLDILRTYQDKFGSRDGSFYATIGGKRQLVVYGKSSLTSWITIGTIPESVYMQSFIHQRNQVIFISFLFLAAAILVICILSGLLNRNLMNLSQALNSLGRDNLNIKVQIKSHDEISQIYQQFNLMVNRINRLVSDIARAENQKRKAEMLAFQYQITPHFLYNTLNTIKFLATLQGVQNIRVVAENLGALLHTSLDSRVFIRLDEEFSALRAYLDIQKYRYSNKFTSELSIEEGLEDALLPKMLLQPIVENALLHGLVPLPKGGILTVFATRCDSRNLCIRIRDNGVGMDSVQISNALCGSLPGKHIGIANTNARIKLYFGKEYGLAITSKKGLFTAVDLHIPIRKEE
jgi:two-component system sensor histidine kinase YesM